MANRPLILLMTRPREAGMRFVAELSADLRARLNVCHAPLIGIAPRRDPVDPEDARGLIFSSANGVRAAAAVMGARDLPCYCVGSTTAAAARAAGWRGARQVGLDAEGLMAALLRDPPEAPLLHLRGAHAVRGGIAALLAARGLETREAVVYDQPAQALTQAARDHLAGPDPVLAPLFSPRTARIFADQHEGSAPLHVQAISDAVARELTGIAIATLDIAAEPAGADMRNAVERRARCLLRLEGDRGPQ